MRGTIHQVQPSKSGKSLSVTVDGKRYQAKLNSGLVGHAGKEIVFDPTEQIFDDGTKIYWINEFTLAGNQAAPASPEASNAPQGMSPYQPLISNLAAHLIAAGKGPEALHGWFVECKKALEGKSDEVDF